MSSDWLKILVGDCRETLKQIPDESVQCCVTSPPYWGLRDYGYDGQIGLEQTPEQCVEALVEVFREVRRILKDDGTCWVNLGDCYNATGSKKPDIRENGTLSYRSGGTGRNATSLKPKDLIGFPWMVAFALRQPYLACDHCGAENHEMKWGKFPDGRAICPICNSTEGHKISELGWYLRQDVIWHKPNPMPESCRDRCTKAHEYIFLLTKSKQYYYDQEATKEPVSGTANSRGKGVNPKAQNSGYKTPDGWDTSKGEGAHGNIHKNGREKGKLPSSYNGSSFTRGKTALNGARNVVQGERKTHVRKCKQNESFSSSMTEMVEVRNKRSVWTVPSQSYKDAHFATYPEKLIEPCILAGSRPGDVVIDPFGGSGTTGKVSIENGRKAILCEMNPDYIPLIKNRCSTTIGFPL